jgi:hypothetical protein
MRQGMHYFIVYQALEGRNESRLAYGVSRLDHAGRLKHRRRRDHITGVAARFAECRGFAA